MNQISPENTITIDELQAAFAQSYGAILAQLTMKNLSLEKQLKAQTDYIQKLEGELVELKNSPHITSKNADDVPAKNQVKPTKR